MLNNSNELTAWDRDHFFHPSTHMGMHARGETPTRVLEGGEGVYITDVNGRKSLDAFAGLYCVNVGYGRTEIADAIAEQARKLAYYHAYAGHGTEVSITLAKMIIDRAPAHMSRVYFGLSGSDANETNIKLIWYYNNILGRPEKKKIISRWRGYHGSGVMTGSLTGLATFHNAFDLSRAPILHTESPYYFRREDRSMSEEQFSQHCADKLEEMILAEDPIQLQPLSANQFWARAALYHHPLVTGKRYKLFWIDMISYLLPTKSSQSLAGLVACLVLIITE